MFRRILIANRGEIACRIIRTCREMNLISAAVYSDADNKAVHVKMADEAYYIGTSRVEESYGSINAVLQAAKDSGADAIHPGYGFLSENGDFAKRCEEEGIHFIGPASHTMLQMGNKITARRMMEEAGVPIIPGMNQSAENVEAAVKFALQIGFPVMLKAAAGGGGIGMQRVDNEVQLREAFAGNQKRAASFFGNGTMYLEKYIDKPRHVEIQVLADQFGHAIHLGERDCSVQRRNQKVLEESPSPFISRETREKMCQSALHAVQKIGYQNAGTIEFLVDENQNFYFLEMNTRLQVEHPVTEEITGIDLVREQIRIAEGRPLTLRQNEVTFQNHALEARIYAEDPQTFFPSPGTITKLDLPQAAHIRHEIGVEEGTAVTPFYDPMLAKIIVTSIDRSTSIEHLKNALTNYRIDGIKTNLPMLLNVLEHDEFQEGRADTGFVTNYLISKN
ncbi:acetyl/propionyl/methylcrotonyl-CoA carboxylase subunit alpha [Alteribacillus sp. HJP-4]|uniref:acetyl-CoA carboxylase biotin carboxylase subunit n=1 Tax=Alteribacillus sp. HJP-4 TaxID=2775394 RepID=UPI0035CD13AE